MGLPATASVLVTYPRVRGVVFHELGTQISVLDLSPPMRGCAYRAEAHNEPLRSIPT